MFFLFHSVRVTGIYSLFLVRLFVYFCLVLLSLTQASYKDLTQKWFVLDPTLVLVAIPDKSSLNHGKLLSVAPLCTPLRLWTQKLGGSFSLPFAGRVPHFFRCNDSHRA